MKKSYPFKKIINHLNLYNKVYVTFIIISILFLACEVDFERNWCQEKLENRDYAADPVFTAYWLCRIWEKEKSETQEEYDAYVRSKSSSCKESTNLQILNFYLENKKKEECKKINRLRPTIHELTM